MQGLFREEAVRAQFEAAEGGMLLIQPLGLRVLVLGLAGAVILMLGFAHWVQVPTTLSLRGSLVQAGGGVAAHFEVAPGTAASLREGALVTLQLRVAGTARTALHGRIARIAPPTAPGAGVDGAPAGYRVEVELDPARVPSGARQPALLPGVEVDASVLLGQSSLASWILRDAGPNAEGH